MKYFEFNDFDELVLPPGDYIQVIREMVGDLTYELLMDGNRISAERLFTEFGTRISHAIEVPENLRWLGWDLSNWPEIDVYPTCDGEKTGIVVNPLNLVFVG